MKSFLASILLLLIGGSLASKAASFHVHQERGDDRAEGSEAAPLQTIAAAVAKAQPGDAIRLLPHTGPIHDHLMIRNHSGTMEHPILFDGNGQTLSGLKRLDPADWEPLGEGLYRSRVLPEVLRSLQEPASALRRFFFVFEGQLVQQGRGSKRPFPGWPVPDSIGPMQWSWSDAEKALYFRLPREATLDTIEVAYPALSNGVATRGHVAHWEVKNLTVRGFHNDGFNFHGETTHFRLVEVAAFDCGDDGLSAHGHCSIEVDGFTARSNSTGICHVDESITRHSRTVLEGNRSYNLYLLGSGEHRFEESRLSALSGGIRLSGKEGKSPTIRFRACEFPGREMPEGAFRIDPGVSPSFE